MSNFSKMLIFTQIIIKKLTFGPHCIFGEANSIFYIDFWLVIKLIFNTLAYQVFRSMCVGESGVYYTAGNKTIKCKCCTLLLQTCSQRHMFLVKTHAHSCLKLKCGARVWRLCCFLPFWRAVCMGSLCSVCVRGEANKEPVCCEKQSNRVHGAKEHFALSMQPNAHPLGHTSCTSLKRSVVNSLTTKNTFKPSHNYRHCYL